MEEQQGIWERKGWEYTSILWDSTLNTKISKKNDPSDVIIPDFSIFYNKHAPYFHVEVSASQKFEAAKAIVRASVSAKGGSCQGGMVVNIDEDREGKAVYPRPNHPGLEDLDAFEQAATKWHSEGLRKIHGGYEGTYAPFSYAGHCWVGTITVTCLLLRRVNNEIVETSMVSIALNLHAMSISKCVIECCSQRQQG